MVDPFIKIKTGKLMVASLRHQFVREKASIM